MTSTLIRYPTTWRGLEDYPKDWQSQGACRGQREYWLYDNDADLPVAPPGVRCGLCPVRDDCFNYGMVYRERGIWGGTTDSQRKRIRRGHDNGAALIRLPEPTTTALRVAPTTVTPKCPNCGSDDLFTRNHRETCVDCAVSWPA